MSQGQHLQAPNKVLGVPNIIQKLAHGNQ